jgi:hypothetical protein
MLRPSAPGLFAAAIALVMDVVYLVLISSEGNNDLAQILPFAVLIGGAGLALAAGSLLSDPRLRASLLWPAALVLTGIGVLAIFSIGVLFLLAGVLGTTAAVRATSALRGPTSR